MIANATSSSALISANDTLNLGGITEQSVVSVTLSGIQDTGGTALTGVNDVEIRALAGESGSNRG